jgi:GT2 family glycosyltransferase/glycosyltransferase involved in cell wall biosynthesis
MASSPDRGPLIDIVVPVYNAPDEVRRCVDSVLTNTTGDYRLLLIDDASSDSAVGAYFIELATRALPNVTLAVNDGNLGFTLTANRGMASSRAGADVVLLNADTIVTRGWLDALVRCAASDPSIGTITPFSNNAEICSLPLFCVNNPWPPECDPEPWVRALARAAGPTYPDLPTGVGFCLYIRRPLLDAIGSFDPVFGLGYGEENDFCLRAKAAGYRNVLCEDAFVLHMGGRSFGDKRRDLAQRNLAVLLERHPGYSDLVRDYIAADPLRPLRELALSHYRIVTERLPGVLHVIHGHGGGTEYHVRSLAAASHDAFRHYLLIAAGHSCTLEEHGNGPVRSYAFQHVAGEAWSAFLGGLCSRFEIDLVHLHNISGGRDGLTNALVDTGIPYGYTVHDLSFACPTITLLNADDSYCDAETDPAMCRACLAAQPPFAKVDIGEWREQHRALLEGAAFVIAPSEWAAATLRRYFPEREIEVIAHGGLSGMGRPDAIGAPAPMADDGRPVVAVLGAIGPDKGARRLERLVELTRERALALRWVLIGYLDSGREQHQTADGTFTMHGPYDSQVLPALLDHYRVQLVAYPSVCPETFSFTLSEAWTAGRPALVPPVGALADRVAATGAGWVLGDDEWRSESRILERIAALFSPAGRDLFETAKLHARKAVLPTVTEMAAHTLAVYRRAMMAATDAPRIEPIGVARCLDALGYVPWQPSSKANSTLSSAFEAPASAVRPAANPVTRVASAALRFRHTAAGRVLYRLAPKVLVDALKARLPT